MHNNDCFNELQLVWNDQVRKLYELIFFVNNSSVHVLHIRGIRWMASSSILIYIKPIQYKMQHFYSLNFRMIHSPSPMMHLYFVVACQVPSTKKSFSDPWSLTIHDHKREQLHVVICILHMNIKSRNLLIIITINTFLIDW